MWCLLFIYGGGFFHVMAFSIFLIYCFYKFCLDTMWTNFLNHYAMEEIMRRAAFIHVDIPGQEDEASDLPAEWVCYQWFKDSLLVSESILLRECIYATIFFCACLCTWKIVYLYCSSFTFFNKMYFCNDSCTRPTDILALFQLHISIHADSWRRSGVCSRSVRVSEYFILWFLIVT